MLCCKDTGDTNIKKSLTTLGQYSTPAPSFLLGDRNESSILVQSSLFTKNTSTILIPLALWKPIQITFLVINSIGVTWPLPRLPLRTAFLIVCCFLLTASLLKILLMLLCLQPAPWKTLRPCSSKHPRFCQVATCLGQSFSFGPVPSLFKITLILPSCCLENLPQYTCKS